MSKMTSIHPRVAEELQTTYAALSARGELLSVEKLESWYAVFRQRFGPEVLRTLSGQALLDLLKGGGRDGLVYWLEFKDDDEFPARFGSIAGGSALKYGVYRRRETGAWTTGSSLAQREISSDEALAIAASHRDQLIAAAELLDRHSPESDDEAYEQLQKRIAEGDITECCGSPE